MSDNQTPDQLAEHATNLLNDPALQAAVRRLEAEYIELWRNSRVDDTDTREHIFLRLKALDEMLVDLGNMRHGPKVNSFNRALRDRKR